MGLDNQYVSYQTPYMLQRIKNQPKNNEVELPKETR